MHMFPIIIRMGDIMSCNLDLWPLAYAALRWQFVVWTNSQYGLQCWASRGFMDWVEVFSKEAVELVSSILSNFNSIHDLTTIVFIIYLNFIFLTIVYAEIFGKDGNEDDLSTAFSGQTLLAGISGGVVYFLSFGVLTKDSVAAITIINSITGI